MADSLEDYASALEHRQLVNVSFPYPIPPHDHDLIRRFRSYMVSRSILYVTHLPTSCPPLVASAAILVRIRVTSLVSADWSALS